MTIYRISKNVNKCYEEYHTCQDCNKIHSSYNDLRHDNTDDGGFCVVCGSDNIEMLIKHTVYAEVFATSKEDALQTAMEMEEWIVLEHFYEDGNNE